MSKKTDSFQTDCHPSVDNYKTNDLSVCHEENSHDVAMEQDDKSMQASGWGEATFNVEGDETYADADVNSTPHTTNKTTGGNVITHTVTRTASATLNALGLTKSKEAPIKEIDLYSYDGRGAVRSRSPKRRAEVQEVSGSRIYDLQSSPSPPIRRIRSHSPGVYKTTGLNEEGSDNTEKCKSHK